MSATILQKPETMSPPRPEGLLHPLLIQVLATLHHPPPPIVVQKVPQVKAPESQIPQRRGQLDTAGLYHLKKSHLSITNKYCFSTILLSIQNHGLGTSLFYQKCLASIGVPIIGSITQLFATSELTVSVSPKL